MRSLSKISLALFAVGFLFAGSAFAQDKPAMTVTGNIATAFGQYSWDKTSGAATPAANQKAFSEYNTSFESNIRFTWASPELDAIVRYRFRGAMAGSGTPNGSMFPSGTALQSPADDVYHEVWWKPGAGNFKLGIGKFQGQDWANPVSGTYELFNAVDTVGTAGEYWMNWTGLPGIDAEMKLGALEVGLAISSMCKPSCNNLPSNSTTSASASSISTTSANVADNAQSMVPHLRGKFGDIEVRAQLPQTSGMINNGATTSIAAGATTTTSSFPLGTGTTSTDSKATAGSGYQFGVKWAASGIGVAVDMASFTDTKIGSQATDRARSSTSLRVDAMGVMFHYFSQDDNSFTNTTTNQNSIALRYYIPAGFGKVIPEFKTATLGKAIPATATTSAADRTNSEFRLIYQAPLL